MATSISIFFSVIIPVYNNESYIIRCLESVRNQTWRNFECLVINDGSTDSTQELIEATIKDDPRIILLNKPNEGLSSARNYGMQSAKGNVFAFLDSDDFWESYKLQQDSELYLSNPHISLTFCSCKTINEKGKIEKYLSKPFNNNPLELISENSVISSGSGVTLKRIVYEKIGLFNLSLRSFEDLEYWFRAAIHGFKFSYGDLPTVFIQRNSKSMSQNHNRMLKNNLLCFKIQLTLLNAHSEKTKKVNIYAFKRIKGVRKYTHKSNLFIGTKTAVLMGYELFKFNLRSIVPTNGLDS
ncbi:glycosyltransferase family 2 protein [Algoriphagus aquimarinus]|uniref:Glycosyltransferase family 2 protein n=1 Tax=Algoriphagus aquimarinus TaxID=237018 RepID=A0A5C7AG55_9BACT|nr:glycosyltransferase family A protein [Algoriphagus aquimarinus]TXE02408.1 glycosyltransferase family 2 protein [Algoriphagus aquimarinus]